MEVDEIIEKTVDHTIKRLTLAGAFKPDHKPVERKTEDLLERYNQFRLSDQEYTLKVLAQIDDALKSIQDDPYYLIIPMYFFEHHTREELAEHFAVTERTITRHKNRLIKELASVLFSDTVIMTIIS